MAPLVFDGRVAIVTGSGQGLGREYALALAARGVKVVINDLGTGAEGSGSSTAPADQVVSEIEKAGGEAVANYDSVEDGAKIVQTAIAKWGRIDIVINNAGILRDVAFKKMSDSDWDLIYRVHMRGTFSVCRAAWPHMENAKYGRIINISSPAGLYGNYGQANYSAMKRAVIGFTLTLAREGAKKNIKTNVVAPLAASRMLETVMPKSALDKLSPKSVANLVTYLSADNCEPTGSIFEVGGQWVAKLRWQRSRGVQFPSGFTADDISARFGEICDFEMGAEFPKDASDSMNQALAVSAKSSKSKKSKL